MQICWESNSSYYTNSCHHHNCSYYYEYSFIFLYIYQVILFIQKSIRILINPKVSSSYGVLDVICYAKNQKISMDLFNKTLHYLQKHESCLIYFMSTLDLTDKDGVYEDLDHSSRELKVTGIQLRDNSITPNEGGNNQSDIYLQLYKSYINLQNMIINLFHINNPYIILKKQRIILFFINKISIFYLLHPLSFLSASPTHEFKLKYNLEIILNTLIYNIFSDVFLSPSLSISPSLISAYNCGYVQPIPYITHPKNILKLSQEMGSTYLEMNKYNMTKGLRINDCIPAPINTNTSMLDADKPTTNFPHMNTLEKPVLSSMRGIQKSLSSQINGFTNDYLKLLYNCYDRKGYFLCPNTMNILTTSPRIETNVSSSAGDFVLGTHAFVKISSIIHLYIHMHISVDVDIDINL
jgi:hypothetical protein